MSRRLLPVAVLLAVRKARRARPFSVQLRMQARDPAGRTSAATRIVKIVR